MNGDAQIIFFANFSTVSSCLYGSGLQINGCILASFSVFENLANFLLVVLDVNDAARH